MGICSITLFVRCSLSNLCIGDYLQIQEIFEPTKFGLITEKMFIKHFSNSSFHFKFRHGIP